MSTVSVCVDVQDVIGSMEDSELLDEVRARRLLRPADQHMIDLIEDALRGRGDVSHALILLDRMRKSWREAVPPTTNERGLLVHPRDLGIWLSESRA